MSIVAASWGLEKTSSDVIGVSVGVLQAATSDNVQPLALLAAEAFGVTIPMSDVAKAKAFQLCAKDQSSAVWSFFKAKIGYRRGDSGWHLSSTDAGLRFLGLAVCLLTLEQWQAAEMLRQCIDETAEDKRLVPTSQHLKQLLHALRPRLAHANFLDTVIAWNSWLSSFKELAAVDQVPPPEAIAKMIKAISILFRLGETNERSYLEISLRNTMAAWTIAFLKWCLGNPPSVVTENRTILLEASESRVLVVVGIPSPLTRSDYMKVQIVNSIDDVNELINLPADQANRNPKGMCRLSSYCQAWHKRQSNRYNVIAQVLPYACHLIMTELKIVDDENESTEASELHQRLAEQANPLPMGQGVSQYTLGDAGLRVGSLLPNLSAVSVAMQKFLYPNGDAPMSTMSLKPLEGRKIEDLPPMKSLDRILQTTCLCRSCRPDTIRPHAPCQRVLTTHVLSEAVAFVLLISLVELDPSQSDTVDEVLVRYDETPAFRYASHRLNRAILSCLTDGQRELKECSINTMLEVVLAWIGHKIPDDGAKSWIMSAYNGQAIYPKLFDDINIARSGLLKLRCLPGSILWKNEQYSTVWRGSTDMEREPDETDDTSTSCDANLPVTAPDDIYPDFKIEWLVRVLEKGLVVNVTAPQLPSCPDRGPMNAILTASKSIFVECAHDRRSSVSLDVVQSVNLRSASPKSPYSSLREDWDLAVVLTDRNESARYFAMCAKQSCVVRNSACLTCCIDVCVLLGFSIVVC